MATIDVELSAEETLAAGGTEGTPGHATYPDAEAETDPTTGLLCIRRQDHVLAEYPTGRYTSWRVVEDAGL